MMRAQFISLAYLLKVLYRVATIRWLMKTTSLLTTATADPAIIGSAHADYTTHDDTAPCDCGSTAMEGSQFCLECDDKRIWEAAL